MATLHVAICRRLGWPVSLSCAKGHIFSRFDNGKVAYNFEITNIRPNAFYAEPDQFYIDKYKLSHRALSCGSDLRRLTTRETIGLFLSLRGRHYRDLGQMLPADSDYAFSRLLFPKHRHTFIDAVVPYLKRGETLFDRGELGHPESLYRLLAGMSSSNCDYVFGINADVQFVPLRIELSRQQPKPKSTNIRPSPFAG